MKKLFQITIAISLFKYYVIAQSSDFLPGYNIIFEDKFEQDAVGDLPAKWSSNGEGQVVTLDGVRGKWFKIMQPTAISPELAKSLPENCTIEFDLYLKNTSTVAPLIMFGLTSLSDVSTGDVYRKHISVKLYRYNKSGSVVYAKNIQKLGERKFPLEGYINRVLHVSISVNKERWRVYLDDQKVVDLPKLLTPEFRKNFFIASPVIVPSPEEGVYISNVKIASGDADARSLLIKQLLEQGSAITSDIQFNSQTDEITPESLPVVDQLGHVLQENPDMNVQINNIEEVSGDDQIINKEALKRKTDKIKDYLITKFKLKKERILTDIKVKLAEVAEKNKTVGKAKQILTEIIKL